MYVLSSLRCPVTTMRSSTQRYVEGGGVTEPYSWQVTCHSSVMWTLTALEKGAHRTGTLGTLDTPAAERHLLPVTVLRRGMAF